MVDIKTVQMRSLRHGCVYDVSLGHTCSGAFVSDCISCSAWDKHRRPQQRASVSQKLAQAWCSFWKQCPSPSSSPDRLSAAHGRWPQLAAGSVAGLPNTNKFEGRVQPGSQRFLAHFQTYYFLLFLESVHCAFKKQGAYFASCSMVYFKLRAVFVYIRS